jgi:hypothetical protein
MKQDGPDAIFFLLKAKLLEPYAINNAKPRPSHEEQERAKSPIPEFEIVTALPVVRCEAGVQ